MQAVQKPPLWLMWQHMTSIALRWASPGTFLHGDQSEPEPQINIQLGYLVQWRRLIMELQGRPTILSRQQFLHHAAIWRECTTRKRISMEIDQNRLLCWNRVSMISFLEFQQGQGIRIWTSLLSTVYFPHHYSPSELGVEGMLWNFLLGDRDNLWLRSACSRP